MIASLVEILNSGAWKQNESCCHVLLGLFLLELCPWSLNQWGMLTLGKRALQLQRQRRQHWHYHQLPSPLQVVFPMWRSEQKGPPLKRHPLGFLLYPEILAFAVTQFLLQPLWALGNNFCRYSAAVSKGSSFLRYSGSAPVSESPSRGPLCVCAEKLRPTSVKGLQNATSLSCKTDITQVWK